MCFFPLLDSSIHSLDEEPHLALKFLVNVDVSDIIVLKHEMRIHGSLRSVQGKSTD